jgi:hypothetical protein
MKDSPIIPFPAAIALAIAGSAGAGQTILYVDDDACPQPGSGTSTDPFCSIQDAIDLATDGDEIVVSPGTYVEAINLLGKAISLRSSDGPEVTAIAACPSYVSMITCDSGEGPETILDGFRISGCGFDGVLGGFVAAGAGMRNEGSSPTVRNCIFSGNVAGGFDGCPFEILGPSGVGGAVYNFNGAPLFVDCLFVGNAALTLCGWCDGDVCCQWNFTCCDGGGFYSCSGGLGGAMYNYQSSPTLINCTIVGNYGEGGEPFFEPAGGAVVGGGTLLNCIVWGNGPDALGAASVRYSTVQGGYPGADNIDADPLFVAGGDYRLSSDSPCIDAGHNNAIAGLADTDLDGNPRFADDPATGDTGCGVPVVVDMGAYEFQGKPARVLFGDIDGNGRVGIRDLVSLIQCMGSGEPACCVADLDLDGEVGMSDVMLLIQMLVHSVPFEP